MGNSRFYITNGNEFAATSGSNGCLILKDDPSCAKKFTYGNALIFLSTHFGSQPNWCLQKVNHFNKDRYVITTMSSFVAPNNSITDSIIHARAFSTPEEAYQYVDENRNSILAQFNEIYVVNDELRNQTSTTGRIQLTAKERQAVYDRDKGICQICHRPVTKTQFTVDHIIPVSRGGKNLVENYRCTCVECNRLKGSSLDSEMYRRMVNIISVEAVQHPLGIYSAQIIRSIVRGTNKLYGR